MGSQGVKKKFYGGGDGGFKEMAPDHLEIFIGQADVQMGERTTL